MPGGDGRERAKRTSQEAMDWITTATTIIFIVEPDLLWEIIIEEEEDIAMQDLNKIPEATKITLGTGEEDILRMVHMKTMTTC